MQMVRVRIRCLRRICVQTTISAREQFRRFFRRYQALYARLWRSENSVCKCTGADQGNSAKVNRPGKRRDFFPFTQSYHYPNYRKKYERNVLSELMTVTFLCLSMSLAAKCDFGAA